MAQERIQKVLAAAGIGSRRTCEQWVLDGRVKVNGQVQKSLPVLVDPQTDRITVDGRPIQAERLVYYILNKPKGVFCTQNDPSGRKRVADLMSGVRERVFPVGRLDAEAMGLLLMTNDGDLAESLSHPSRGVPKTYRAQVDGNPSPQTLRQIQSGVWMSEGKSAPAEVTVVHRQREKCVLEITLRESRHNEIRRLLARFGHKLRRLVRIRMGKLSIAKLPLGTYRPLTESEVRELKRFAQRPPEAGSSAPAVRRSAGGQRPAGGPRPAKRPALRGGPASTEDRPRHKPGSAKSGPRPRPAEPKTAAKKARPRREPAAAPWQRRIVLPDEK